MRFVQILLGCYVCPAAIMVLLAVSLSAHVGCKDTTIPATETDRANSAAASPEKTKRTSQLVGAPEGMRDQVKTTPAPQQGGEHPTPKTIRVAFVHSEASKLSKAIEGQKQWLAEHTQLQAKVGVADATETATAEALFRHEEVSLPEVWTKHELVVVQGYAKPKNDNKKAKDSTRRYGFAVLKPPSSQPVYLETVSGEVSRMIGLATVIKPFAAKPSKGAPQ